MSFGSVLATIGKDIVKVFTWIGSSTGQNVIKTGEAVVVAIDPALSGLVTLANTYISEAFKIESLASAASQQTGSGVQKLAAVVSAVTPAALQYSESAGLPTPTADQIQTQVNAIVAFLNAIPTSATVTTPTTEN